MDIVDANQPQADSSIMINKSWKHPTAAKQVIIQRDAAGNNSTWLARASAWNSLLSAGKLVLKWLYIGIEWPKDINSQAFARRTVTGSDQPPPQALRFSHGRGEREKRVTGDEPQGSMGRVQTAGEARCLLPAFLCAHILIDRETSGYEAGIGFYLSGRRRKFGFNVHITINTGQLLRRRETHTG